MKVLEVIKLLKTNPENVLKELNKVNELFNLIDKNILNISDETLKFINKREELRKQKQFDMTDMMRKELQEKYFFEDEQSGYLIINKI